MNSLTCSVCGGVDFESRPILWQGLVDEWQLSPFERIYIDRQQGEACVRCGANLRSVALANALRRAVGTEEVLSTYVSSSASQNIKILELNEAGSLGATLKRMPNHILGNYPEVDMHNLPYEDNTFDIVIHSDTLEHIPNPIHALGECRRVLKPGGAICYTVPIIVGRLSRNRDGLQKSYHGNSGERGDDFVVQTEFGADFWSYPIQAGFSTVVLHAVEYPAAVAISAYR